MILLIWVTVLLCCSAEQNEESKLIYRFAFGSCFNPNNAAEDLIWKQVEATSPDHLILLGDQIYVDQVKVPSFPWWNLAFRNVTHIIENEYKKIEFSPYWQSLISSLPDGWSVTYDDHDYGNENADKTFAYRNVSQDLFWDFSRSSRGHNFPLVHRPGTHSNYSEVLSEKTSAGTNATMDSRRSGVYSSFINRIPMYVPSDEYADRFQATSIAGREEFVYKVILLDARSNKDPKNTPNGDFLGEEQWAWFEKEMFLNGFSRTSSSNTSVRTDTGAESCDGDGDDEIETDTTDANAEDIDLILIGSGIQVLPDNKMVEETWAEFPAARERLLKMATLAADFTNVVFLSGDIHSAEISRATAKLQRPNTGSDIGDDNAVISEDLWELTSSGLTHTFAKKLTTEEKEKRRQRSLFLPLIRISRYFRSTGDWIERLTRRLDRRLTKDDQRSPRVDSTRDPFSVNISDIDGDGDGDIDNESQSDDGSGSRGRRGCFVRVDDELHRDSPLLEVTKGRYRDFFFNLYQQFYPNQFRERGRNDLYGGVHFALMDIEYSRDPDGKTCATRSERKRNNSIYADHSIYATESSAVDVNSSSSSPSTCNSDEAGGVGFGTGAATLVFKVVNHLGDTVLLRRIPLDHKKGHRKDCGKDRADYFDYELTVNPYWGCLSAFMVTASSLVKPGLMLAFFLFGLFLLWLTIRGKWRVVFSIVLSIFVYDWVYTPADVCVVCVSLFLCSILYRGISAGFRARKMLDEDCISADGSDDDRIGVVDENWFESEVFEPTEEEVLQASR